MSETINYKENVKVRKPHKCFACGETIEVGSLAQYEVNKDEGQIYALYICKDCIKWCNDHQCRDCFDDEDNTQDYVAECRNGCKSWPSNTFDD